MSRGPGGKGDTPPPPPPPKRKTVPLRAFPVPADAPMSAMTLRDYFAARALSLLLPRDCEQVKDDETAAAAYGHADRYMLIAAEAYQYADAMMEAREEG